MILFVDLEDLDLVLARLFLPLPDEQVLTFFLPLAATANGGTCEVVGECLIRVDGSKELVTVPSDGAEELVLDELHDELGRFFLCGSDLGVLGEVEKPGLSVASTQYKLRRVEAALKPQRLWGLEAVTLEFWLFDEGCGLPQDPVVSHGNYSHLMIEQGRVFAPVHFCPGE